MQDKREEMQWRKISSSVEETMELGRKTARSLYPNAVLCLFGDLAAGKTAFVKGVVEELTGSSGSDVTSPTFHYMNNYPGKPLAVYHFDLYRMRDSDEFLSMGFEEFLHAKGVACIEWPERIAEILACLPIISIRFTHMGGDQRLIEAL